MALSHETRRQIARLIDRKGQVEYVMAGDERRAELPDSKRIRAAAPATHHLIQRKRYFPRDVNGNGFAVLEGRSELQSLD